MVKVNHILYNKLNFFTKSFYFLGLKIELP